MTSSRHLLLIAYINSHLPELLRVARAAQQTGRYAATLLFVQDHDSLKYEWAQRFEKLGVDIIDQDGRRFAMATDAVTTTPGPSIRYRVKTLAVSWAKKSAMTKHMADAAYRMTRSVLSYSVLQRRQETTAALLRRLHIDLIVLCEDNAAYATGVYTTTGHRLGIPSVIVPYTIANASEAAEHAYDQRRHWVRGPVQQLVARPYPHWVHRHKQQSLLLLSPLEILAQEKLHLAPPDPWMINSGSADAIAAESPAMVKYYQANGLPSGKIVLTGSLVDDTLAMGQTQKFHRRDELNHHYGLDPHRPLLLSALPPPWFPRPVCDFATYHQLLDFWIGTLRTVQSYNVVLNLHPGITHADRNYIGQAGLPVAVNDVSELIPLADIYVANISATIRWAIACGLPVLNYDVYKYRFHDYDAAPGVLTVESQEDFRRQLTKLTTDHRYFSQVQRQQQEMQEDWGRLDGHSGQRMIQLFEQLMTQSSHKHG